MFLKGNWSPAVFVTNYLPIVFFPIAPSSSWVRTPSYKMDFVTDVAEFDAMTCVPLYCGERHACARNRPSRYILTLPFA